MAHGGVPAGGWGLRSISFRIKADLTIHVGKVGSVAHQPAGNGV
jgi:hypothetical protein